MQLKRHDASDIFIHWFNAVCWLLLLPTGIALIENPLINPLGDSFPVWVRGMFGSGAALLSFHVVVGFIWIVGMAGFAVVRMRNTAFFLRESFAVDMQRDPIWMVKKMLQMTIGFKGLKALGFTPSIPDQGYYNMGQKGFAQAAVLGSILIALSGIVMVISTIIIPASLTWLVSICIFIHYIAVGLVFAGLLMHIYMAAISPEERPSLISMFTGSVDAEYAMHHHRLWYEKVKNDPEVVVQGAVGAKTATKTD